MAQSSEQDLRELLAIPDNDKVLFCHDGARTQSAAVPMHLLGMPPAPIISLRLVGAQRDKESATYCTTDD